jgi:chloramphenicol-sensitive protein RarD
MTPQEPTAEQPRFSDTQLGVAAGVSAYTVWGFSAYFFSSVPDAGAIEINVHRAIWAVPIAAIVLLITGRTGDILPALKNPRIMGILAFTTLLVGVNWGFYVWALGVGRATEASLGFYINPLLNVLIGVLALGERLTRAQIAAVVLAAIGVIYQTVSLGVFPWLAFLLGTSFSTYGYLRKTIAIGPAQGFLIESSLLSVAAIGWLIWQGNTGVFFNSGNHMIMLMACGAMTAAPLILFATGARKLKLSTIGLLQYIAPTMIFLTAVLVLGEQLKTPQLICFICIWTALAIYSCSAILADRKKRRGAKS